MKRLQIGDPAPDISLVQSDGSSIQLSTLWQKQPVVLDFLRHFG